MAERIESRMVAREDGAHIASTGNMVSQDWDDAWDSDEDEKSAGNENQASTPMRNRHSIEEERRNTETFTSPAAENDDDDAADAWGWGDDDEADGAATEEPAANAAPPQPPPQRHITPEVRELTLSEKYWISSMPQPVFNTVVQIYEEGAQLTRPEFVANSICLDISLRISQERAYTSDRSSSWSIQSSDAYSRHVPRSFSILLC